MIFGIVTAAWVSDPYASMAAALPEAQWSAVEEFTRTGTTGKLPAFIPAHATPLEASRAMTVRYASIFDALRAQTESAYTPASPLSRADRDAVDRLAGFVVQAAHVRFADGVRHEAVTLLLDGMTMARRVGSEIAERSIADAFAREREGIPLTECERIRSGIERLLPPSQLSSVNIESRVRLCIIGLRMRIEAYRWRFGKVPERLIHAAPLAETLNPRTGKPFAFERIKGGYHLGEEAKANPYPR